MKAPINQLGRFCLFLVISIFLFAGCSFFDFDKENTASVVFEIPDNFTNKPNTRESRQIFPNTSRDALPFEDEDFYFDIALKGGFEDSKTILLEKDNRVVFNDIPVGKEIWAEAEIYKNGADSRITLNKLDDVDTFFMQTDYWSSTQSGTENKAACAYYFSNEANGSMWQNPDRDNGHYVCAIREF